MRFPVVEVYLFGDQFNPNARIDIEDTRHQDARREDQIYARHQTSHELPQKPKLGDKSSGTQQTEETEHFEDGNRAKRNIRLSPENGIDKDGEVRYLHGPLSVVDDNQKVVGALPVVGATKMSKN